MFDINQIIRDFWEGLRATSAPEFIAVIAGIASVWFSKKENILVYPVGLVNTIIYIYLSFKYHLLGEASVNFYYTVMSIYGWMLWAKKNNQHHHLVNIEFSNRRQWIEQLLFCGFFYVAIFFSLTYLKKSFATGAIPWADALASSTAFTGMWLMAKKKVESWFWWIVTDFCSVPLYFVKGLVFSGVYYLILLFLAFLGLAEWMKKAKENKLVYD